MFEDKKLPISKEVGVFYCINSNYLGRFELPDNLKVLFRPVSLTIPNYRIIAEVLLFSQGFADYKRLARKIQKLYKHASEQLSQQTHYDFGMRALKTILKACNLKTQKNPNFSQ